MKKIFYLLLLLSSPLLAKEDSLIAKTPPAKREAMENISKEEKDLIAAAQAVRSNSYCPYSHYRQGAAARSVNKKIYTGVNVENASLGLSCCAAQIAMFNAVSNNDANIEAIAVINKGGGAICGACRQVLNEFNPNMKVIMVNETGSFKKVYDLKDLFPEAWGPQNILQ